LHPVIRLACFVLLVAGLTVTSKIMIIIILPLWVLLLKYSHVSSFLPLLKRLRWLFLSLFILNLWFNSPTISWLPEISGLLLAFERVMALIFIVLAAHLLVITTPINNLIATLLWWLKPLNYIGFSTETLAVRMALVLDIVQVVQNIYTKTSLPATKNPIKKISERVASLLTQVLIHAETTPLRTLEIPKLQSPPLWQWSYPLFFLILLFIGHW
jgi:biotin transport system permease protein